MNKQFVCVLLLAGERRGNHRYAYPVWRWLYRGVFSTHELAEAAKRKLELAEVGLFGYAHDYIIRPVHLDSVEAV